MIALTDVGLAYLMAAARAIDLGARGRWLQAVADEFDPHPDAARRAAGRDEEMPGDRMPVIAGPPGALEGGSKGERAK
jgi:hypothetical protein